LNFSFLFLSCVLVSFSVGWASGKVVEGWMFYTHRHSEHIHAQDTRTPVKFWHMTSMWERK
jgi:hypothetical protein